jgi:hypothetical protein
MKEKWVLSSNKVDTYVCKKSKVDCDSSSLPNDPIRRVMDAAIRDAATLPVPTRTDNLLTPSNAKFCGRRAAEKALNSLQLDSIATESTTSHTEFVSLHWLVKQFHNELNFIKLTPFARFWMVPFKIALHSIKQ